MKRVLSFVLALLLTLLYLPAAADSGESRMADEREIIQIVRMIGIMDGDEHGNLNLDHEVTRAEFIKMAVSASALRDSVVASVSLTSPFPDVKNTHWAAPYVTAGVNHKWISGYLDGTFRPDNRVTLEEAVVIALRLLGYTNSDFIGAYPDAQLAKYINLEMNADIPAQKGDVLSRRDCMKLLYNALNTKTKGGQIYCTTLGYSAGAQQRIDYLSLLLSNTEGPYPLRDLSELDRFGFDPDDAIIYRDGAEVGKQQLSVYDVLYYCVPLKTIWSYSDKVLGRVQEILPNREQPSSVMIGGKTYVLHNDSVKYKFSPYGTYRKDDFVALLLGRDGTVADAVDGDARTLALDDEDYFDILNDTIEGPVIAGSTAGWEEKIPFSTDGATVYYHSYLIPSSQIQPLDILYYSAAFRTVWVYRDRVTGVCEAVSPGKEAPASVTISGKSYLLGTVDVKHKFSTRGSFDTDQVVTLLLGRSGRAVDVIDGDVNDPSIYNDGTLSYSQLVESTIKGPVIVRDDTWKDSVDVNFSAAVIYRGNRQIPAWEVQPYDVVYYSGALNSVWVYNEKRFGVLEAILPNKTSPLSVTVSGKTYALETSSAKYALSAFGSYSAGDMVTLLLGKDGGVADLFPAAQQINKPFYGVVTGITTGKTYTAANGSTYRADALNIADMQGGEYEYEYAYAKSFARGDVVRLSVDGGSLSVSVVSSAMSNASLSELRGKMEQGLYAGNAGILDVYRSATRDFMAYTRLYPSHLAESAPGIADILYYGLNAAGEIETLVLNDFTGDLYQYAMLKKSDVNVIQQVDGKPRQTVNTFYQYLSDGVWHSVDTSGLESGAVGLLKSPAGVVKIFPLTEKLTLETLDGFYATAGNITYSVAPDAAVYIRTGADYFQSTFDDIINQGYTFTAYCDRNRLSEKRIRVIVASRSS